VLKGGEGEDPKKEKVSITPRSRTSLLEERVTVYITPLEHTGKGEGGYRTGEELSMGEPLLKPRDTTTHEEIKGATTTGEEEREIDHSEERRLRKPAQHFFNMDIKRIQTDSYYL